MSNRTIALFFAATFIVVLADEITYYWWRRLHPGRIWHGVFGKSQLQTWNGEPGPTGQLNYSRSGGAVF